MKVRLSSEFCIKFQQELMKLLDKRNDGPEEIRFCNEPALPLWAIEDFLTTLAPDLARVLKHHLLAQLLEETAATQSGTQGSANA